MEKSKTVLVTGASGALGSQMARRFAAGGHATYLGYRGGKDAAEALAAELTAAGGEAHAIHLELSEDDSVRAAVREIAAEHGGVDVLINNAAYRPVGRFLDLDDEAWNAVLGVNLVGAVRTSRAVLPWMREQGWGRIINISGIDAYHGNGGRSHVAVSKAGLIGLSRAIAVEMADRGITVNTVVPGSFATPRDPKRYPLWGQTRDIIVGLTPLGRQGDPAELAELCWYLASESAGFITGQEININGGWYPLLRLPLTELE